MRYHQLRRLYNTRDTILVGGHNSADGTGNDSTIDAVITRDPNNYLVPKINGFTLINTLHIAIAVLAVIILLPMAIKSIKSYGIN